MHLLQVAIVPSERHVVPGQQPPPGPGGPRGDLGQGTGGLRGDPDWCHPLLTRVRGMHMPFNVTCGGIIVTTTVSRNYANVPDQFSNRGASRPW